VSDLFLLLPSRKLGPGGAEAWRAACGGGVAVGRIPRVVEDGVPMPRATEDTGGNGGVQSSWLTDAGIPTQVLQGGLDRVRAFCLEARLPQYEAYIRKVILNNDRGP